MFRPLANKRGARETIESLSDAKLPALLSFTANDATAANRLRARTEANFLGALAIALANIEFHSFC